MAKYVSSKVTINDAMIKRITKTAQQALEMTAEAIHTDIVQEGVVPRDTGQLEESMFVDDSQSSKGSVSIVTSTPYARRLYFHPEYHFHREPWTDEKGKKHDGNPNAQGKWYEPWISGEHAGDAQKYFKYFMERLM